MDAEKRKSKQNFTIKCMKQNLKKLKSLLVISMAGFLFSCQEELISEKHVLKNDLKISQKSFQEVYKNPQFNNALFKTYNNVKNKSNYKTSNTSFKKQYGFDIYENTVNIVEKDSITSYTMCLLPKNDDLNSYENLVIQIDNHDNVKSFIIKSTPDNSQIDLANNSIDFKGTKIIRPLYGLGPNETSKGESYEVCITYVTGDVCPVHPATHTPGTGDCKAPPPVTTQYCFNSSWVEDEDTTYNGPVWLHELQYNAYNQNQTNGPSGTTGYNTNSPVVYTFPLNVLKTSNQIEIAFKTRLKATQLAGWNNPLNKNATAKIIAYVTTNQIHDVADDIDGFAIKSILNPQIIEENIDDSTLPPCPKAIVTKPLWTGSP